MKYAGLSGFNSVLFSSEKNTVIAKRIKNKIIIKENSINKTVYFFDNYIHKIPIIRGYWILLKDFLKDWKLLLFFFLSLILLIVSFKLVIYYNNVQVPIIDYDVIYNYNFTKLFLILVPIGLIFKILPTSKYHAAEHMVSNAFDKKLTLDVETVKKQTRVHRRCGTNYLVIAILVFIVIYYLFYLPNIYGILMLTLAFPIAYEIMIFENKYFKIVTKPLLWVGYLCQFLFFTSNPKDKHIEVALASFNRLLKLENENGIL
ncbi:DUF1385 domain-containing protein [Schinkia azotoformans]|uniref:DUF1385 domain-containing protein n=1 Tax=Schinkia azotoformans TaxID=1454 RepID=UPI002E1DD44A|nr:DUF1385 domain-containing protein [Schinkia azotoformans]